HEHGRFGEVRPRPAVPVAELHDLDLFSLRAGEDPSEFPAEPAGLDFQLVPGETRPSGAHHRGRPRPDETAEAFVLRRRERIGKSHAAILAENCSKVHMKIRSPKPEIRISNFELRISSMPMPRVRAADPAPL